MNKKKSKLLRTCLAASTKPKPTLFAKQLKKERTCWLHSQTRPNFNRNQTRPNFKPIPSVPNPRSVRDREPLGPPTATVSCRRRIGRERSSERAARLRGRVPGARAWLCGSEVRRNRRRRARRRCGGAAGERGAGRLGKTTRTATPWQSAERF